MTDLLEAIERLFSKYKSASDYSYKRISDPDDKYHFYDRLTNKYLSSDETDILNQFLHDKVIQPRDLFQYFPSLEIYQHGSWLTRPQAHYEVQKQLLQLYKKRLTLPGHNYLGPGNTLGGPLPTSKNGWIAFEHDLK